MLPEEARFCGGCGRPYHQTTAMATPKADVRVRAPPPPRQSFWTEETPPARRGIKRVVKVTRLDKIVGLTLTVVVGVPLLLVIFWMVFSTCRGSSRASSGPYETSTPPLPRPPRPRRRQGCLVAGGSIGRAEWTPIIHLRAYLSGATRCGVAWYASRHRERAAPPIGPEQCRVPDADFEERFFHAPG